MTPANSAIGSRSIWLDVVHISATPTREQKSHKPVFPPLTRDGFTFLECFHLVIPGFIIMSLFGRHGEGRTRCSCSCLRHGLKREQIVSSYGSHLITRYMGTRMPVPGHLHHTSPWAWFGLRGCPSANKEDDGRLDTQLGEHRIPIAGRFERDRT